MNVWSYLILVLVIGAFVLAFRVYRKNQKKGGCGCGCSSCDGYPGCAKGKK